MRDQLHIRNAEAAHRARVLARQTGRTISDIVLDALRQYRPPGRERPKAEIEHWRHLLRCDREQGFAQPETPIEAFYDPETSLPA